VDKLGYMGLLNSYLLPEMARHLEKTESSRVSQAYLSTYVQLINACVDRERIENNSYFAISLMNYKILENLAKHIEGLRVGKHFELGIMQMIASLLALKSPEIEASLVECRWMDRLWEALERNFRCKNVVYSVCLSNIKEACQNMSLPLVKHLGSRYGLQIQERNYEANKHVRLLMEIYRKNYTPGEAAEIKGCFSQDSSLAGSPLPGDATDPVAESQPRHEKASPAKPPRVSTIREFLNEEEDEKIMEMEKILNNLKSLKQERMHEFPLDKRESPY
jgi:hypothetical protein